MSTPYKPPPHSDTPTEPPIAPEAIHKTAKKRSKKVAAHVVLDDDALESEMKKLIVGDEELYLRILRYEVRAEAIVFSEELLNSFVARSL